MNLKKGRSIWLEGVDIAVVFRLLSLFVLVIALGSIWGTTNVAAIDNTIYEDGIYRYVINDAKKKEVSLIGFDIEDTVKELVIPGKAIIGNKEYTITRINLYSSFRKDKYDSVNKIIVSEDFSGTIS